MSDFARRYTRITAGTTSQNIGGSAGATIIVHGISVANTGSSDATVTLADQNGNTIDLINVAAEDGTERTTKWLADKGLQVTTPANVSVTVYHSQPGA